jgi:hypothetical protein
MPQCVATIVTDPRHRGDYHQHHFLNHLPVQQGHLQYSDPHVPPPQAQQQASPGAALRALQKNRAKPKTDAFSEVDKVRHTAMSDQSRLIGPDVRVTSCIQILPSSAWQDCPK